MKAILSFPADIKPLTSLRFFAALSVVIFHLLYLLHPNMQGLLHHQIRGFFSKGYLAVDFFFMLSGFILLHVYGPRMESGQDTIRSFYIRRLARLYPVHLLLLVFMASMVRFTEINDHGKDWVHYFDWDAFLAHLTMTQAWGPSQSWAESFNGPSWSISAEWMVYLLFPFLLKGGKFATPGLRLLLTAIFLAVLWLLPWFFLGHLSTDLVYLCAFRVVPEFIFGMALYTFMKNRPPISYAPWILGFLSAVVITLLSANIPDIAMIALMAGIIAMAADTARLPGDGTFLSRPRWVYLGEISYSIYMIHMPLLAIVFGAVQNRKDYWDLYSLLSVIFFVSLFGLSALCYRFFEMPARTWIGRVARHEKS